jgi:hypothetical protein
MCSLPDGHINSFTVNGYASKINNLPFGTLNLLQMTQHNVGALVVVKPGEDKSIAGIVTERGNEQISVLLASNS